MLAASEDKVNLSELLIDKGEDTSAWVKKQLLIQDL